MRVLVSGTRRSVRAGRFLKEARILGALAGANGIDLLCGTGNGICASVLEGYRGVPNRGRVILYLPSADAMRRAGEIVKQEADEVVETGLDYPMRNLVQMQAADAVFVLTGDAGTLSEIVAAQLDYALPLVAVRESGTAVRVLELLLDLYPSWRRRVGLSDDARSGFNLLLQKTMKGGHTEERVAAGNGI